MEGTIHNCTKCGGNAKLRDKRERYPWGDYRYTGWVECEKCGHRGSECNNGTAAVYEWNKAN